MKKARRQELRTNELSIFLHQVYDSASRNANYVIGGAVAVVAILVICFAVYNSKQTARQTAWNDYYSLREKSFRSMDDKPNQKAELIDEVRKLSEQHRSDGELGARFMELAVDIAYGQALRASPTTERERRLTLLKEAKSAAAQILEHYASQSDVAPRTRMALASIEESLVLMGEGNLDTVRKLYQAVLDASPNPFVSQAKRQLETLDKRTTKLELVATRPAEPPATQAVGASLPTPPIAPAPPPPAPEPAPATTPAS